MKLSLLLVVATALACGQDLQPGPTLFIGRIVSGGETNTVVFSKPVTSITWETNPPPPGMVTTNITWATNPPPPLTSLAVISGKTNVVVWNGAVTSVAWESLTNSAIAHPERKKRVIGYKKECPECGVSLTSTNITSWVVNDDTNSWRMTTVSFECLGCDEKYFETFRKPIRKTKVEELTVETVK